HVITEYYDAYFNGFEGFTPQQREDLRKSLVIDDRNSSEKRHESERERAVRIEGIIDKIEGRRKELKVEELSFNSFYE
ncbi:UNVERIFIED_CONTAM: conjugal transfer protein TraG, partial [Prevotella sp. 15_C9]